jgi:Spy/CpxP family protein refolding chaperone
VAAQVRAPAPGNGAQSPPSVPPPGPGRGGSMAWEWWNDVEVQKELPLTTDKVRRIHEIFTRRNDDLRKIGDEYRRAQQELDKTTRERLVDEATYTLQVVQYEALRSRLNESRTVMLYRLTRELTPEQYKKLQDIRDRRIASFGRGRGPEPR